MYYFSVLCKIMSKSLFLCGLVWFVLRVVWVGASCDLCFCFRFAFVFKSPSLFPQCWLCLSARAHNRYYPVICFSISPFTSRRTSRYAINPVKHSVFEPSYTENIVNYSDLFRLGGRCPDLFRLNLHIGNKNIVVSCK